MVIKKTPQAFLEEMLDYGNTRKISEISELRNGDVIATGPQLFTEGYAYKVGFYKHSNNPVLLRKNQENDEDYGKPILVDIEVENIYLIDSVPNWRDFDSNNEMIDKVRLSLNKIVKENLVIQDLYSQEDKYEQDIIIYQSEDILKIGLGLTEEAWNFKVQRLRLLPPA